MPVQFHQTEQKEGDENIKDVKNLDILETKIINSKNYGKFLKYLWIIVALFIIIAVAIVLILVFQNKLINKDDDSSDDIDPNIPTSEETIYNDSNTTRILIISTGGTFNSVPTESGLQPKFNETDLRERLKPVSGDCNITFKSLFSIDSGNIQPEHWKSISDCVKQNYRSKDGIIIIHGTDTMAYTSSMLSHMLEGIPIPVVITGSQMGISNPLTDALENMRLSIYMARNNYPGVYVVFNRKVMLGKYVSKVHSKNINAFESINYENVGEVNAEGLQIHEEYIPKIDPNFKVRNKMSNKVIILKLSPGLSPNIIDTLIDEGYKGIIIESYGLGGLPNTKGNDFASKCKSAIQKGIKIVILSQCTYDGVDLNVYETGVNMKDAGIIDMPLATKEYAYTRLMWELGNNN